MVGRLLKRRDINGVNVMLNYYEQAWLARLEVSYVKACIEYKKHTLFIQKK